MSTQKHISKAERFGCSLGRLWRSYVHRERKATAWLIAQGLPAGCATALLWIVKLGVLAALFYAAFWLALILLLAIGAACAAHNATPKDDEQEPEWRIGLSGYGLYRGDVRIDPGDLDNND